MDGLQTPMQDGPSGLSEQEFERLVRFFDWRVVKGDKPAFEFGESFRRLSRLVRAAEHVRDQAFAGMVVAEEALAFGLASCTIELGAESVYDDQGGYHRDVSVHLSDVRLEGSLPDTPVMQALLERCFGTEAAGDLSPATAGRPAPTPEELAELAEEVADELRDKLQDRACDLYEAFALDPSDMSDFTLNFSRAAAMTALTAEEPSGHAVFAASCPEEARHALAELAQAAQAVPAIARLLLADR